MNHPQSWKVFLDGDYVASCHRVQDAVVLARHMGLGARIRHRNRVIVWREGQDDSSDLAKAAAVIQQRLREYIAGVR